MEVSGRKDCNKQDKLCKPCEDRELATGADGFCMECEEYMCQTCFDSHKQWKICRGHTLTSSEGPMVTKEHKDDFEKCNQHLNELIKFYCPEHEQVGCGDCMILEHKSCKVEYIRDKSGTFKESRDFIDLVKGAEKCHIEAKEVASSIRNNKIQVVDINQTFSGDVEMFKEEMFSHITRQTNAMLKKGEDVKATDMKKMDKLKNENEGLIDEISILSELFDSLTDTPNKLFARSILQKPKLNRLREQLNNIKERNKITVYEFKRDCNLERSVKDCQQLGNIQKNRQINEKDLQDEVRPKKTAKPDQAPVLQKYQPLLERQLICRNSAVGEECLSHADNGSGDVGLSVDKTVDKFNEVEISNLGQRGTIDVKEDIKRKERTQLPQVPVPKKPQPLLDRQLICRNIAVDGEYLSYADNGSGDVGLFVDKERVCKGRYFEVEILSLGQRGTIAIGLVPPGYPENHQPGWGQFSTGYHADDGLLYDQSGSGKEFGPKCNVGDRIGCGIIYKLGFFCVVFTRNGRKIGEKEITRLNARYPAIGMHSAGEKVKAILDAKMPLM